MNNTDENYWKSYDGLQDVKHKILKSYLGGWFPKLCSWQGRVIYIDCHAGRGKHKTGHLGSPLLALNLLLDHHYLDGILANTEVNFFFFEKDETNYHYLINELDQIDNIPEKVNISAAHADYQTQISKVLDQLDEKGRNIAPSFAFVDPYGFSLTMDFLNRILAYPTTELLINFMYRYIDLAITHKDQDDNMDNLFGCPDWRRLRKIEDHKKRSEEAIKLFGNQLLAEYVTHMYMRSGNGVLKYALIHATNHDSGRELMKDTIWRVVPDGTFSANEKRSPDQPVLLVPEPDLKPFEQKIIKNFSGRSIDTNHLYDWLLDETYIKKHLHKILRKLRNSGIITSTGYDGRFAFSKNPTFHFPDNVDTE